MARYSIQAPDGNIVTLEGPDGAPEDEVIAQAQSLYKPAPAQINNLDDVLSAAQHEQSMAAVPVSEPQAIPSAADVFTQPIDAPTINDRNFFERTVSDPFMRGVNQLQQSVNVGQALLDINPEGAMQDFIKNERDKAQYPLDPEIAAGTQNIVNAQGFRNTVKALADSPGSIWNTVVESLASSAPSLVGGAIGSIGGAAGGAAAGSAVPVIGTVAGGAVGGVTGGMAGAGAGSYITEFTNTVSDQLQQSGVDMNDPEAMAATLADPAFREEALKKAGGRAEAIALFDALSMGVAGRVAKPVQNLAKTPVGKTVAGGTAEIGTQAGLGGGGEAAAQINTEGRITSPGSIALEGFGEIVPGVIEGGINGVAGRSSSKNNTSPPSPAIPEVESAPQPAAQITQDPQASLPAAPVEPALTPDPAVAPLPPQQPAAQPTAETRPGVPPSTEGVTTPPAPETIASETPKITTADESTPAAAKKITENRQNESKKVVTPDGGMEIDTNEEVIDLAQLQAASEDLQPRDRTKATSDMQIQKIANELDPERLIESRTTDQGAPIVGDDNVVESGNGRVAAIRQAYTANGEQAARYRAAIQARGYNTEGMQQPVLIRRRTTPLSPEDRVRFTGLSNKSQIAEMSSTEKAKGDAGQISDDVLDLHKGGEPDSQANQDFAMSFIGKVVTENETGSLIGRDKRLTQEGIKRVKAALVAKAYDNPDLVENIFDSADPEVKSIGNVLRDRAPEFAQLGAAVRRGEVPDRFNIAPQLMKAVEMIRNAKRDGRPIQGDVEGTTQTSLIEEAPRDSVVDQLVRQMYRPGWGRMLSQPALDKMLSQYANTAREQRAQDLFGENKTTPAQLLDSAYKAVTADMDTKASNQNSMAFSDVDSNVQQDSQPAPAQASRQGKEADSAPADSDELAKTAGRKFSQFSTNKGVSKFRTAYQELGLDPDLTVNMAPEKQLDILSKAMKDRFGMKIELDNKLDRRAGLDMLHDLYNNLSFLAGVFNLPLRAIGLNNTLTLKLQKNLRGALGVYSPTTKTITLPEKSNSFIHEWMHALDDHMLNLSGDVSQGDLFSGSVRKNGVIDSSDGVQAAFANLMHAVFYDKAMLASIKLDLEHKLQRAKSDASKRDIQRKISQLENGNYKGIKGKNNYYQGVKKFAAGNEYWSSPEEMLARVFEAYSAHKITQAGGDSTSIAKGDLAYLSNVDDRLAKTFPKMQDRQDIFDAVDQFMARLAEREILGRDQQPMKPMAIEDMDILDPASWAYNVEQSPEWSKPAKIMNRIYGETKNEAKRWRQDVVNTWQDMKDKRRIRRENPESVIGPWKALQGVLFSADRAALHSLESRLSSPALKELLDRVITRPGQYNSGAVKQDFFFNQRYHTVQHKTRLGNLMKAEGYKTMTDASKRQIRDIMVSQKSAGSKQEIQIAGKLRSLMDSMYADLKDVGVEIGYLRDQGYLSRLYLKRKIISNREKFSEKAAEVYAIQFNKNVGEAIEDIIKDPTMFVQHLKRGIQDGSIPLTKKEAKALIDALNSGTINEDQKVQEMLEGIIDQVRDYYSTTAAADWLNRMENGPQDLLENAAPSAGFTKKRALPPEADTILAEFMETDPFAILDHYADLVGRRVGLQKVVSPTGKASFEQLLTQMAKEGVRPADVTFVKERIEKMIGQNQKESHILDRIRPITSMLHFFGMASLLPRAAMASLPERYTAVVKTKRVSDLARTMFYTVDQIAGTKSAKEARAAAESIAIIFNEMSAASLNARMGGYKETDFVEKATSQFFIRNGLVMIDNSNRLVTFRISLGYFKHLATRLLDKSTNKVDRDLISQELAQYGISPEDVEAFSKWLISKNTEGSNIGGFSGFEDVDGLRSSPFGMDLILALNRFNDETIQRPTAADRPYASKNAVGSLIFSVTSFAFAFWENVVKSEAKKIAYVQKNYGTMMAARQTSLMMLSWSPLIMATVITNAVRLALFDEEKWDELKEKDELMNFLGMRTISSTGVLGPVMDRIANAITGARYQVDIATTLAGAYLGTQLRWLQSIIAASNASAALGAGDSNSPNTNTAEYNAIKATWKTLFAPAIAGAMTMAPGGGVFNALSGLGILAATSSTTADKVATSIVGKKGGGNVKTASEPREPQEPKEPREI